MCNKIYQFVLLLLTQNVNSEHGSESKNMQLAGHQLLRPREVPPVGTPTERGTAYFSNSRSFHDKPIRPNSRGDQGLNYGPTKFTSSANLRAARSQTHSVRGRGRSRGGGRSAAFSSRAYLTPSTRTTSRALQGLFEEEKSAQQPFMSSFQRQTPLALTPSEHEMALRYPTLESQLAHQNSSPDLFEQRDDFPWSPEGSHKPTQSHFEVEHDDDIKHPDLEDEEDNRRVKELEYELAVARMQATSFQQQLDNLTAKLMEKDDEEKEKEKERKEAQEREEKERAEEKRHKEEMRQLERDKKSSCDQQRMKAMADAYVKRHGLVSTTEDYERNFLPNMDEFFDQEATPMDLVDLDAELWTPCRWRNHSPCKEAEGALFFHYQCYRQRCKR